MSIALEHKRRTIKADDFVTLVVWNKETHSQVARLSVTYEKAKRLCAREYANSPTESRIVLIPAHGEATKLAVEGGEKKRKEAGGRRPNVVSAKAAA